MIDETRKALEAYCPEVGLPLKRYGIYDRFSAQEINAVIAAAIREAIIERGDWKQFLNFAFNSQEGCGTDIAATYDSDMPEDKFYNEDFIEWLTDAETFCQVAAQNIDAG